MENCHWPGYGQFIIFLHSPNPAPNLDWSKAIDYLSFVQLFRLLLDQSPLACVQVLSTLEKHGNLLKYRTRIDIAVRYKQTQS